MIVRFFIAFIVIYSLQHGLISIAATNTLPTYITYPIEQFGKLIKFDWSREGE